MKKLIVLAILGALLLSACGVDAEKCELNWEHMQVEAGDESWLIDRILNNEHLPNSVGDILQNCLRKGWDGWRP